jgi:hypothetical protein
LKKNVLLALLAVILAGWLPSDGAAEESMLQFSGDLRGRYDGIWYSDDATGPAAENRGRLRYRIRLNANATINEHAKVAFRFGTNGYDSRSGNQTLGSGVDFGPNEYGILRAYLVILPFSEGKLPNQKGHWAIHFGRVPIPFVWKNGKDFMLLDHDFNPSGVSTTLNIALSERITFFTNLGYFIMDENRAARDPFVSGVQGGLIAKLTDKVQVGVRGSYYYFDYLDADFIVRSVDGTGGATSGGGNIEDGLTGNPNGGDLRVAATHGFVKIAGLPVVAFGGFSTNLSAEPSRMFAGVTKENIAYNAGLEGGDKKKAVTLGIAYYFIEANAFPSQFIDSDLFDGRTNRKGIAAYGSRQIWKGTDFKITWFNSNAIEQELPAFEDSVAKSKRTRIQIDLVYKF